MSIKLVTGVPGAGKTYYVVNLLWKKYCTYNKEIDEYVLDGYTIFTNIDGLKLPVIDLQSAIEKSKKSIDQFFTVDFQEVILKKYNKIIYVIDEVQLFFPYGEKKKEVEFLFQYHRHLGIDFILCTQDKKLLNRSIQALIEIEIHAVPRSIGIPGSFYYQVRVNDQNVSKKVLRKDKRIFTVYKSFQNDGEEKIKNQLFKQIAFVSIFLIAAGSWGGYRYYDKWSGKKKQIASKVEKNVENKFGVGGKKQEKIDQVKPKKTGQELLYPYEVSSVAIGDKVYYVDKETNTLKNPRVNPKMIVLKSGRGSYKVLSSEKPFDYPLQEQSANHLSLTDSRNKEIPYDSAPKW